MTALRSKLNPIIRPQDIKASRKDFEVICSFNAGVTRINDEVLLLLRVAEKPINKNQSIYLSPIFDLESGNLVNKVFEKEDKNCDFSDSRVIRTSEVMFLTSISHLRIARSKDGVNFAVDEKPALFPSEIYDIFGIEDPRISLIEGTYYINYSAISPSGVVTCLVSTKDFKEFKKHGVIFGPDNKDVEIFPEKINEKYYALNRPESGIFGCKDIWISESPDLICWGNHRRLMSTRKGYWDEGRVGGSAVPIKTERGWLEIYHGATKDDRYCLGAVLMDLNQPWKIIARTDNPILEPEADYEVNGFFGNVVFSCGALYEENIVKVYYGSADTYVAYAEIHIDDILNAMRPV
jgi:beta-1,2-mannobiose phosphorylase / 1,2-beta-oligomannan phosphorylase